MRKLDTEEIRHDYNSMKREFDRYDYGSMELLTAAVLAVANQFKRIADILERDNSNQATIGCICQKPATK